MVIPVLTPDHELAPPIAYAKEPFTQYIKYEVAFPTILPLHEAPVGYIQASRVIALAISNPDTSEVAAAYWDDPFRLSAKSVIEDVGILVVTDA